MSQYQERLRQFDVCMHITMAQEGGYDKTANVAANWAGGSVRRGSLRGSYRRIRAADFPMTDIENLHPLTVGLVYYDIWDELYGHSLGVKFLACVFDAAVVVGLETAIRWLHLALDLPETRVMSKEIKEILHQLPCDLKPCARFQALRYKHLTESGNSAEDSLERIAWVGMAAAKAEEEWI